MTLSFAEVAWTKSPVKKSQIPQNLKLEVTAPALNFVILKPETLIKKKRTVAQK